MKSILSHVEAIISTHASNKIGFGHLSRSINLYFLLKKHRIFSCIFLLSKEVQSTNLLKKYQIPYIQYKSLKKEKSILLKYGQHIQYYFLDKGNTSSNIFKIIPKSLTISIDNLGEDKKWTDILYTPLPYHKYINTNIYGINALWFHPDLYKYHYNTLKEKKSSITLSFGGADPYDLTYITYQILCHCLPDYEINIVLGPLYKGQCKQSLLKNENHHLYSNLEPQLFYTLLAQSSILITSFGLTVFESLFLKTPCFLINHTPYHQQLANSASLPSASLTGKEQHFESFQLTISEEIQNFIQYSDMKTSPDFESSFNYIDQFLEKIKSIKKPICPICSLSNKKVVFRSSEYNLYYCQKDKFFYKYYLNL